MEFSDPEVNHRYRRLGFKPDLFGMSLQIGIVEIKAVEHPFKGVAISLTYVGPRIACQFETSAPTCASREQIAALIYVNFALNIREEAANCRAHFRKLGLSIFQ